MCMIAVLWTLMPLQEDARFLREHRSAVMFNERGARIYERCDGEALYRYEPEKLVEFLGHSDPTIRRNAACELADLGRREGIDLVTVRPEEPWTRRRRIAESLMTLDPERAADILRPMLDDPHAYARAAALNLLADVAEAERLRGDPSDEVRRTAASVLGLAAPDPAPEPRLSEAEGDALRELRSDDAASRDAAVAVLMAASESAVPLLEAERDRTTDAEVRIRLDRAIREVLSRAYPPVTLSGDVASSRATNNGVESLTFYIHPDGVPAHKFWERHPARDRWMVNTPGDCAFDHETRTLAPGASYEFRVPHRHLKQGVHRVEIFFSRGEDRIEVVSAPFAVP